MITLKEIHVTQRKLRNVEQLHAMAQAIADGVPLPPVRLAEFNDGSVHVEDGHHRCTAYFLAGRLFLEKHEYLLIQKDEKDKTRFGRVSDLVMRITRP